MEASWRPNPIEAGNKPEGLTRGPQRTRKYPTRRPTQAHLGPGPGPTRPNSVSHTSCRSRPYVPQPKPTTGRTAPPDRLARLQSALIPLRLCARATPWGALPQPTAACPIRAGRQSSAKLLFGTPAEQTGVHYPRPATMPQLKWTRAAMPMTWSPPSTTSALLLSPKLLLVHIQDCWRTGVLAAIRTDANVR